jgi:hypothetical protein
VVKRTRYVRHASISLIALLAVYWALAYFLIPLAWKLVNGNSGFPEGEPRFTLTADNRPGDPLNVALVGSETAVKSALGAAGWVAADPLGIESGLKIVTDILLERRYITAPVSALFLNRRREDLAFEQAVGADPAKRHHVRFWLLDPGPGQAVPIWIGAASFDTGVGLSHETGQITHHIASDVDRERDKLRADLMQTRRLAEEYMVPGFHKQLSGFNGGGDKWVTDGSLWVGVIR